MGISTDSGFIAFSDKPWVTDQQSAYVPLLARLIDGAAADMAWLNWAGGDTVVVPGRDGSGVSPLALAEFPQPPHDPLLIVSSAADDGAWSEWCRSQNVQSCAVAPIIDGGRLIGSLGLLTSEAEALRADDLRRVTFASWLAAQAHRGEVALRETQRQVREVGRTVQHALPIDAAAQARRPYQTLAEALAQTLDATYCRLVVVERGDGLAIQATAGKRPPRNATGVGSLPLARLVHCQTAIKEQRTLVLDFARPDFAESYEREWLFTPGTQVGVLVPFFTGPALGGILLVGEERRSRSKPYVWERLAVLEFFARRAGDILRTAAILDKQRRSDRQRQRRIIVAAERSRLARDLHDDVGQALSTLLLQVRVAKGRGAAGAGELEILEQVAQQALDAARAITYGLRQKDRADPLHVARSYAEVVLQAAGCSLSWLDTRPDGTTRRTSRVLARVIKEAVTNIVRHAKASHVDIAINLSGSRIRATVRDDGVGFVAVPPSPGKGGMGLLGCRERLAQIGGTLEVQSSRTSGTLVIADAPWRSAIDAAGRRRGPAAQPVVAALDQATGSAPADTLVHEAEVPHGSGIEEIPSIDEDRTAHQPLESLQV